MVKLVSACGGKYALVQYGDENSWALEANFGYYKFNVLMKKATEREDLVWNKCFYFVLKMNGHLNMWT